MESFGELLAFDERRTLEFFFMGLQDVSERKVDRQELLYNASVLAHYAQVSTTTELEMPAPATLSAVFDHFVMNTAVPQDHDLMETTRRSAPVSSSARRSTRTRSRRRGCSR